MKRASYRAGVEWLALNDETAETDFAVISSFITTILLADLFGVTPERVARDIIIYRDKHRGR